MDVKYLGYADSHEFTAADLERAGLSGKLKDVTFTQGEGSIQTVTKEVGEYLITEHAPLFAEATDENRDVTNASATDNAAGTPAFAATPAGGAPAPTGDTSTPGDSDT